MRMARRKIVKAIRPTNLYNVVRDFYRLAEEKKHAGASRCSAHTARRLRAHPSFRDGNERFYCCREKDRQRVVDETVVAPTIVTILPRRASFLRQLCIKGLTNHNLSPPLLSLSLSTFEIIKFHCHDFSARKRWTKLPRLI